MSLDDLDTTALVRAVLHHGDDGVVLVRHGSGFMAGILTRDDEMVCAEGHDVPAAFAALALRLSEIALERGESPR